MENKSKKQNAEKDNGSNKEERDKDKGSKSGDLFSITSASFSESKGDKPVPFFDDGEEEFLKSHGLKEHSIEEDANVKSTLTARDIFGKWGEEPSYPTSYPSFKEKGQRDNDEEDPENHAEEELYRSRKHSSKKEEKAKKKEKKEKEKSRKSPSPPTTSREKERPLFPAAAQESPIRHLSSTREEFEHKISSVDEIPRYGYLYLVMSAALFVILKYTCT